jgi:hypothetical protein
MKFSKVFSYLAEAAFLFCLLPTLAAADLGPVDFHPEAKTLIERPRSESKASKIYKWSVAALLAGSVADAGSSWGRLEANPALRNENGRFSSRGLVIKSSLVAGVLTAQTFLLRKDPNAMRAAAWTNFVLGGALGGVAAYNLSNRTRTVPSYLQPR